MVCGTNECEARNCGHLGVTMRYALAAVLSCVISCSPPNSGPRPQEVVDTLATEAVPDSAAAPPQQSPAELSDRDGEVLRYVLRLYDRHEEKYYCRTYFLTTTPRDAWGDTGNWAELSVAFHESIKDLALKYQPASGAYLLDGSVLQKGTDRKAWMQWIHIRKWISDSEVEVEHGVWTTPLGGGASVDVIEKVEGEWKMKERVSSWVS